MTSHGETLSEVIPAALDGERVDRVVAPLTGLSRSVVAALIKSSGVSINGEVARVPSQRVKTGDELRVDVPEYGSGVPEPDSQVAFEVVHEDEDLLIIDKPSGVVVHPGAGRRSGTLVEGLLARYPDIAATRPGDPVRPGIVHRLDAGTSGLLAVARTQLAYETLVDDMKSRRIERGYLALAWGEVRPDSGIIDAPIGRSARNRTKMTVAAGGREARTRYEVLARHQEPSLTLLAARLETGRTHQIRVHLDALGNPVVGDARYGANRSMMGLERPFLHAQDLKLRHPVSGKELEFRSELPADLAGLLEELGLPRQ